MPATKEKVVQTGVETTWGTPVAATKRWAGVTDASLVAVTETEVVEVVGRVGPGQIAVAKSAHGTGQIALAATYEDLMQPLDMLFGTATPSGSGPYTRAWEMPVLTVPTPGLRTVEFGGPGASYRLEGALATGITVKGEAGGYWSADVPLIGETVSTVTLANLSEAVVELIRTADTVVYVDPADGTIGTTAIPATVISFELMVESGRHLKQFVGSLTPGAYGDGAWTARLTTTLEFTATAKAIVDAYLGALQERQIRIQATSGAHSARLDFAGVIVDSVTLFDDRDGNKIVSLAWQAKYNTALGNALKLQLVNGVS